MAEEYVADKATALRRIDILLNEVIPMIKMDRRHFRMDAFIDSRGYTSLEGVKGDYDVVDDKGMVVLTSDCTTTLCLAGWGTANKKLFEEGLCFVKMSPGQRPYFSVRGINADTDEGLARFFGMSMDQCNLCFFYVEKMDEYDGPDDNSNELTVEIVENRLREIRAEIEMAGVKFVDPTDDDA
jgi:hypothetical protein